MGFFRQFENFDPVAGEVPDYPFGRLPAIASRARRLLQGRTRDQIIGVADTIDWIIEMYFESAKEHYIRGVLYNRDSVLDMLPEDERTESGLRSLLSNWPSDADDRYPNFSTEENTSEVEALKESIDGYAFDDESNFPSSQKFEFFAVLALWKLAEADDWLKQTKRPMTDIPELQGLNRIVESLPAYATVESPTIRYSLAGECALDAMDALGWAEHLQIDVAGSAEVAVLTDELRRLSKADNERVESRAQEKISLASRRAAIKRHQENHAMKAEVFEWCAQHLQDYPSMEKAAEAIAGKGKLVPVAVRTGRDWILEWKRKQRSARTP